jgi:hypothetical protein
MLVEQHAAMPTSHAKLSLSAMAKIFSNKREMSIAEMWRGSEKGSYSRLIDCCITQL